MAGPLLEKRIKGFTLFELVAVLVLLGILGSTFSAALLPSSSFQLQASRDQVVAAFVVAQQRSMSRLSSVRLSIETPSGAPVLIDVREDSDADRDYDDETSIRTGGTSYPLRLLGNQRLTEAEFIFNRLGQTSSRELVLSQGSSFVNISVNRSGYIR